VGTPWRRSRAWRPLNRPKGEKKGQAGARQTTKEENGVRREKQGDLGVGRWRDGWGSGILCERGQDAHGKRAVILKFKSSGARRKTEREGQERRG